MALDLSNDWKVVDDLQTVTYFSKTSEGVFGTGTTVNNTYWEELDQKDYLLRPNLLTLESRAVHLWTSQLSSIVPKIHDRLIDKNSKLWYVDTVEYYDLDTNGVQRYRCLCYLDNAGI